MHPLAVVVGVRTQSPPRLIGRYPLEGFLTGHRPIIPQLAAHLLHLGHEPVTALGVAQG
jgi:hypothetical protein